MGPTVMDMFVARLARSAGVLPRRPAFACARRADRWPSPSTSRTRGRGC